MTHYFCRKSYIKFAFLLVNLFSIFPMTSFALSTFHQKIIGPSGEEIKLKGVNWFGFDNGQTMVDGLYSGPDSLSLDFGTVAYRIQLLGFNAIRLPFSFQDLHNLPPKDWTHPDCTIVSHSDIMRSVTPPHLNLASNKSLPPQRYPAAIKGDVCNSYLPSTSTFDRYVWVVKYLARNGFYVLMDNHLREDKTALHNPSQWVKLWAQLVAAVSEDPIVRSHLMIDVLNEPDEDQILWGKNESIPALPALKDLYINAMSAVYEVNPEVLFFIEGTGQLPLPTNWGDGFTTNQSLIKKLGLSDPSMFFDELLTKPYKDQIVIAPHVYPASVTTEHRDATGEGLWNRLSQSFGYLTAHGYKGKIFPVAPTEFGSTFKAADLSFLHDFALYLQNHGAASDGKHTAIESWFYWCWNANSGDTGGLVANDWREIVWDKIDYLTNHLGLRPWYL